MNISELKADKGNGYIYLKTEGILLSEFEDDKEFLYKDFYSSSVMDRILGDFNSEK